jgi:RNase P protein component
MTWRSLAKKSEFQKVYEDGVKKVGRFLVVYLLPADDLGRAVVASRKIGGAVQRNRAKRLLREAFQAAQRQGRFPAGKETGPADISISERFFPGSGGPDPAQDGKEGLWVVLVARQRILRAESREVRDELDSLLDQW